VREVVGTCPAKSLPLRIGSEAEVKRQNRRVGGLTLMGSEGGKNGDGPEPLSPPLHPSLLVDVGAEKLQGYRAWP